MFEFQFVSSVVYASVRTVLSQISNPPQIVFIVDLVCRYIDFKPAINIPTRGRAMVHITVRYTVLLFSINGNLEIKINYNVNSMNVIPFFFSPKSVVIQCV